MLYVFGWLVCGLLAAAIYRSKGRSFVVGLLGGALLGPIGILLALVSGADRASVDRQQVASGNLKPCPHCAELIKPGATVCRYCQRDVA